MSKCVINKKIIIYAKNKSKREINRDKDRHVEVQGSSQDERDGDLHPAQTEGITGWSSVQEHFEKSFSIQASRPIPPSRQLRMSPVENFERMKHNPACLCWSKKSHGALETDHLPASQNTASCRAQVKGHWTLQLMLRSICLGHRSWE